MPALDKILSFMASKNGHTLSLKAGAIPQIHTDSGTQPAIKQALEEVHLLAYLKELADGPSKAALDQRKPCRFRYQNYEVAVEFGEGGTAAILKPVASPSQPQPSAPSAKPEIPPASREAHAIDEMFREMIGKSASDLHLTTGEHPILRLHGEMIPLTGRAVLTASAVRDLLWPICPIKNREEFERTHDSDFAYEIPGLARFRCNYFMDRKGMGAVFRQIPTNIPTVEQLGLSKPVVDLCWLSKGLVVVTGPTGSGKSTTLAALVDYINRNRTDHIITIEDPIEFVHSTKKCLLNQREVGVHTDGFKKALRAALREDPDIVLVGEMRDLETIAIAIETAETGHLVFGTLHTTTAPSTIDRIIDQFPADRQAQVRVMLSESLKGVLSQTLCKKIGGGRVCAMEILLINPSTANLIREGKTYQIPSIMQTQKGLGNICLNDALLDLVKKKLVEPKEAYIKSVDKMGLKGHFERNQIPLDMDAKEA